MSIDERLRPGLEAYREGEFVEALVAWEEPWQRLEGDEKALCLSLIRLAGGLHHHQAGREETARRLWTRSLATLESLPGRVLGLDVKDLRRKLRAGIDEPPELRDRPRFATGTTVRFGLFLLILLVGGLLFRFTPLRQLLDKAYVIALLEKLRHSWWAPLAHVSAYAIIAPIGLPVTPLLVAGGIVFGLGKGALLNGLGTILGAGVSFQLAKVLGKDFIHGLFGEQLEKVETYAVRHGFWSLVGIRFVPIPFPIVNFGQALAGVPWSTYMITSSIGLMPSALVYTYLATSLWEVAKTGDLGAALQLFVAVLLVGALGFSPTLWRLWQRRHRLKKLMDR
ncbi:MAG: DUF309 domain-containing protein [Thermoanaerobaculia bacterium]|nr:DUF309 domain-containing protein [Thermoanaerobaculia bacterium]